MVALEIFSSLWFWFLMWQNRLKLLYFDLIFPVNTFSLNNIIYRISSNTAWVSNWTLMNLSIQINRVYCNRVFISTLSRFEPGWFWAMKLIKLRGSNQGFTVFYKSLGEKKEWHHFLYRYINVIFWSCHFFLKQKRMQTTVHWPWFSSFMLVVSSRN